MRDRDRCCYQAPDRVGAIELFLRGLRSQIVETFASLDPSCHLTTTDWKHGRGEGGGKRAELRGDLFEKAAVNYSALSGEELPMGKKSGPFFATGVSVITHMMSPYAPTVHFNLRYIETLQQGESTWWFGGGYDLTPMGPIEQADQDHFFAVARGALDPYGDHFFSDFHEAASRYFYLPHRQKERGVGGIFFDHFNTGQEERDYALWKAVGESFLPAIMPIYERCANLPYSCAEKEAQNRLRAHYVEFNLLYDRGTQFGLLSRGNTEAILSSMPPTACW